MSFDLAACAEMLWTDKPMDWRCARLDEMGFAVGLWNWVSHDVAKLKATGAKFSVMNGFVKGNMYSDEGADVMLASAREAAMQGKEINVRHLNLLTGEFGPGGCAKEPLVPTPQRWMKVLDTLNRLCDLGEELNVVFALENLNAKVDHPGMLYARSEECLKLVSAVNRKQMRLNLDLYHVQIDEGNVIETCKACLPYIGELQVADVPGRFEPGTGEMNYANIATALDEMGYQGSVTLESHASGSAEDALAAFKSAFSV